VVLQTSASAQSAAIQAATRSPYSHAGVVEVTPEGVYVIEALGRVSRTPAAAWIRRGEGRRYTPRSAGATSPSRRARRWWPRRGRSWASRTTPRFEWSDDRIYCSELVAKAYERGAHRGAGRMQRLGDLDLGPVLAAARARYGDRLPLDQEVLTPASLAEDPAFTAVHDDFHPADPAVPLVR